jgi:predicted AAA+ superfamily ATPase
MYRVIEDNLIEWKKEASRKPLLVRGARQIGKTFTIRQFGEDHFKNMIEINFEQYPSFKQCFNTLNPKDIIETISLLTQKDITPGDTLLFFDEIQECPEAITSLRYFYEQMPGYHVIGAGSLLEFSLTSEQFRMPVGRIQNLFMQPMSFVEFLMATGYPKLVDVIEHLDPNQSVNPAIHDMLLKHFKTYSIVGGMPECVAEFSQSQSTIKCQRIQTSILQTYRDDFGKYASKVKHKYLEKIFYSVPKMVGKKFKYSNVDNTIKSRELKEALELLEKAGVVTRIKSTTGEGLPLNASARENYFKVAFLDVGLMQSMCGATVEDILEQDILQINNGDIAEQAVAQELLTLQDVFSQRSLFYWAREARSSNAEVDFVISTQGKAIPVEVKAGKTGTLKSMHLFLDTYPAHIGIKISSQPLSFDNTVLSIPLYAVSQIHHLYRCVEG